MSEGSIDVQLQVCTSIMSITMDCEFVETQKEGRALIYIPLVYFSQLFSSICFLLYFGPVYIAESSSVPGLQSEVCVSVLCVAPVLCMAYSLVVRMLLLLSGDVERNPGPTISALNIVSIAEILCTPHTRS